MIRVSWGVACFTGGRNRSRQLPGLMFLQHTANPPRLYPAFAQLNKNTVEYTPAPPLKLYAD